jgi:iron-sulfur cluster repair protein YtfE (RIC family)
MSDHAPASGWDDSTRPTLAEPADTVYPPERLAVSEHLVEVHDMLRGELARLKDMLEEVRRGLVSVGDARTQLHTMTMRQNNWTLGAYCASYCRIVNGHHGLEDAGIFPHLRRAEPGIAPVIDQLAAEHVVIHGLLDEVDRAMVQVVAAEGATEVHDALGSAIQGLADALLGHLAYEERELRGPLTRHGFY